MMHWFMCIVKKIVNYVHCKKKSYIYGTSPVEYCKIVYLHIYRKYCNILLTYPKITNESYE